MYISTLELFYFCLLFPGNSKHGVYMCKHIDPQLRIAEPKGYSSIVVFKVSFYCSVYCTISFSYIIEYVFIAQSVFKIFFCYINSSL